MGIAAGAARSAVVPSKLAVALSFCILFHLACGSASRAPLPPIQKSDYSPILWPAVERAYEQVRANPGSAEANGRLAIILHSGGKYELGEQFYERAIAKDPSFRWQYYLSQLQTLKGGKAEALRTLESAMRLDSRYIPVRLKYARLLLEAGRAEEARQSLEETIRLDKNSVVAEFELARAMRALNRQEEAIAHLEKACARLPEYGAAQYSLAVAYRDAGRMEDAKTRFRLYEHYKDRIPAQDDPLEREFLAVAQGTKRELDVAKESLQRGDLANAASQYEALLKNDAESVAIRSSLVAIYYKLREFGKAEAHYREAVRRNPQFADAHYHYGMALQAQQRPLEAEEAFRLAIQAHATHAGALTQMGLLREKAGDNAAAVENYRKALASEPGQRQANFLFGRQLVREKKYDEGIGYLEKTISQDDEQTPWFLRALAGAQSEAGRPEAALKVAMEARAKAAAGRDQRLMPLLDQDIERYKRMVAGK
jgi:tetratricopeptide (TPR) repeat protein